MDQNIDGTKRAKLIRAGNIAFNEKDYNMADKIFKAVNYKDGLVRLGDYFYFDKHQPLVAYGYYKLAGHTIMLDRLNTNAQFAVKCWLE